MTATVDTRARLLTAANELFRRQGYNGTGIKQVVEAAEATVGSLYHFFPGGKDDLTAAVIASTAITYRELFELIADAAPDIATGIEDFFSGAADVLAETDFIDPCPIGGIAREVASTNDGLRQIAANAFHTWIDAVAVRLRSAGIEDAPARSLATTLVTTVEGNFVLSRTMRDAEIMRSAGRHMAALVRAGLP